MYIDSDWVKTLKDKNNKKREFLNLTALNQNKLAKTMTTKFVSSVH